MEHLRNCIPTIYSNLFLQNFEVIAVDNASYMGSEHFLNLTFPYLNNLYLNHMWVEKIEMDHGNGL